jgi:hypothetical protein
MLAPFTDSRLLVIMRFPMIGRLATMLCVLTAFPTVVRGQVGLTGIVMDAASERPLANAIVSLWNDQRERMAGQALSDSAGRYHFGGLTGGGYTLAVRALGYRPTQLTVVLDSAAISQVSVALAVQPVRLQSIQVARPVVAAFGDALDGGATSLEGERRSASRSLDLASRTLTARDLRDAVTFAERDPMRALQRVAGVAARDGYSSAMWTRGASFDKTTVTFDGLPLFNALHAAGLMSTINPDAIGALEFHPGVQPADAFAGGAATAAVQSRRSSAFERTRASAELSLLTGRLAMERSSRDGRHGVLVAARRSHLDRSAALMESVLGARAPMPFAFSDAALRADVGLTSGLALEVAAMRAADRLWGDVPGVVERTTGRWGGGAGRATLVWHDGSRELRFTVGASGFSAVGVSRDTMLGGKFSGFQVGDCGCIKVATEFTGQPLSNAVGYRVADLRWQAEDDAGRPVTNGGIQVTATDATFATTGSWPHSSVPGGTVSDASGRVLAAGWGERTLRRGRATAVAAVRVEHAVDDPLLVGPRLSAEYRISSSTVVTAGASRAYQHAQALTPSGSGRSTIATAEMFWVVAGNRVPALRADLLTGGWQWSSKALGAEVTVGGYRRWSDGLLVSDPRPGVASPRDLFVVARGDAQGVEVGARKHIGASTIAASYAGGRSTLHARDMEYAAPWVRDHVLRGSTSIALINGVRWMSQYAWESGAPYTRYFNGYPTCDRRRCRWGIPPVLGSPSEHRTAPRHSLDSSLEWVLAVGETRVGAFLQAFNLVRSGADATYLETHGTCAGMPAANTPCDPMNGRWELAQDVTLRPMPRTWSAGLRVVY